LLYAGDNLRDFSEDFVVPRLKADDPAGQRQAIRDRQAKVARAAYHWGTDWFILPNPVYGEWQKPLGVNPRDQLRLTKMKRPAR
jgi:acid phosphatase